MANTLMVNIELPKDADGNEVPLDTTILYEADGTPCEISHFEHYPRCNTPEEAWHIMKAGTDFYRRVSHLYLTPPDSLKQLADDLNRFVNYKKSGCYYPTPSCSYAGHRGDTCDGCKLLDLADPCLAAVLKDVAARVNRLCGDTE